MKEVLKMKYRQVGKWFYLPDGRRVTPFNGEDNNHGVSSVSWSHGFTHLADEDGKISHCGQLWFEENASADKEMPNYTTDTRLMLRGLHHR